RGGRRAAAQPDRQQDGSHGAGPPPDHSVSDAAGDLTSFAASSGSVGPMPYEGHQRARPQAPHAAFLAWQTRRPWKITRWLKSVHSFLGTSSAISASALTGAS